jgi:hypothetical protein
VKWSFFLLFFFFFLLSFLFGFSLETLFSIVTVYPVAEPHRPLGVPRYPHRPKIYFFFPKIKKIIIIIPRICMVNFNNAKTYLIHMYRSFNIRMIVYFVV